nr:unnamed protein product [Callosobruchus analis]
MTVGSRLSGKGMTCSKLWTM